MRYVTTGAVCLFLVANISAQPVPPVKKVPAFDAKPVVEVYEKNPRRAEEQYKGKRFTHTFHVAAILDSSFAGASPWQVVMVPRDKKDLLKLDKDQKVTVEGTLTLIEKDDQGEMVYGFKDVVILPTK